MSRKLIVISLASIVVTAACGGSDDSSPLPTGSPAPTATATPEPTPTPTATPLDIGATLQLSGDAMGALSSFHVKLDHEAGAIQLIPGLNIKEAEVDVVSPDRLSARFRGGFGGFAVSATFIVIGEVSYLSNPLTGEWEKIETDISPLGFFSPSRGISTITSQVHDVKVENAGGKTLELSGALPAKALESLLGPSSEGASVSVALKLNAESYFLLEARIEGKVVPTDVDDAVRVLTISKFNEEISIEPPE